MSSILQQIANTIGGEFKTVRASLYTVQTTANNALSQSDASSTYATKSSLSDYAKSSVLNDYSTADTIANTYATQLALSSYLTTTMASNTYATKTELGQIDVDNVSASIFTANNISATKVSIGNLATTGNALIGSAITAQHVNALQALSALRAEVGNTGESTNALTVNGATDIKGRLTCDSLEVQGSTTIVNTQTVEVSDTFIELNKSSTGTIVGQESGIEINRGSTASQNDLIDFVDNSFYPDFEWDGTTTSDYAVENGEVASGDPKPVYVSKGNGHANTNNYKIIWYSNPNGNNFDGTLMANLPTWLMIEVGAGIDGDFSGGSADLSSGSSAYNPTSFNYTQSTAGGEEDKAKVYWDNVNDCWHFKKGTANAQLYTGALYSDAIYAKSGSSYEQLVTSSNAVTPTALGNFTDFQTAFNNART